MLTEIQKNSLEQYITKYYIAPQELKQQKNPETNVVKDFGKMFSKTPKYTLEQLMEEVGESFHDKLFRMIDKSGMYYTFFRIRSISFCIAKTKVERQGLHRLWVHIKMRLYAECRIQLRMI